MAHVIGGQYLWTGRNQRAEKEKINKSNYHACQATHLLKNLQVVLRRLKNVSESSVIASQFTSQIIIFPVFSSQTHHQFILTFKSMKQKKGNNGRWFRLYLLFADIYITCV